MRGLQWVGSNAEEFKEGFNEKWDPFPDKISLHCTWPIYNFKSVDLVGPFDMCMCLSM